MFKKKPTFLSEHKLLASTPQIKPSSALILSQKTALVIKTKRFSLILVGLKALRYLLLEL